MTRVRVWTCRRVAGGVKCLTVNASRTRKCSTCGKPRPARKRPAHMAALDLNYAQYVELNGGDWCAICRRSPSAGRRLDRDHDHSGTGQPRGLLCARCNRAIPNWCTSEWLRLAAAYLDRAKERAA